MSKNDSFKTFMQYPGRGQNFFFLCETKVTEFFKNVFVKILLITNNMFLILKKTTSVISI